MLASWFRNLFMMPEPRHYLGYTETKVAVRNPFLGMSWNDNTAVHFYVTDSGRREMECKNGDPNDIPAFKAWGEGSDDVFLSAPVQAPSDYLRLQRDIRRSTATI